MLLSFYNFGVRRFRIKGKTSPSAMRSKNIDYNWGHIFSFEFWHFRKTPLTFKGVQPGNSRSKTRAPFITENAILFYNYQ